MSIQIGKPYTAVATNIKVTVDVNKLGPRQLAGYKRMVKTGILRSNTPQGMLARHVRAQAGAPFIDFHRWRTSWENVPYDCAAFFDRVTAACTAHQLSHPTDKGPGHHRELNEVLDWAKRRVPNAMNIYYIGDSLKAVFKGSSPLPPMLPPTQTVFEIELLPEAK